VAAMTYLLRHPKSGVYYFRRTVPDDLRETIGKTAIKESLGTKDVREAKRRAHPVAARVDADFAKARAMLGAPVLSHLSDAEIERLSAMHLHDLLADDEETRIHGDSGDELYLQLKRQVEAAGGFASSARRLSRPQDDGHGFAARRLVDMDRQEAALVVVGVEQRQLLMPAYRRCPA